MARIASGDLGVVGAPRWRGPLARVALFCAAFGFLWFAQHRYTAWVTDFMGSFEAHSLGWATWMLATAAVGFCFALAAFLPAGRLTFRPIVALALAILPVLGILHFAAVWLWHWSLPDVLMKGYFYMDVAPQALLAALVGVALAAGIRGAQGASVPQESA